MGLQRRASILCANTELYGVYLIERYRMKKLIFLLLGSILAVAVMGASCTGGNELECASSYCPNFSYSNNTCAQQTGRTCVSGQVFVTGCVTCSSLNQSSCSSTCPDHLWTTFGGSTTCHACYSVYGAECIKCTSTICTACSFTSGTVLSSDSKSCVTSSCGGVANCIECYSGGTFCYRCSSGYIVTTNYTCAVSTCNINNCIICSGSTCGNCFPGYSLASTGLSCSPVCSDIYCSNCIGPGVCGTCISPYQPDVNGICQINCALISVSNCATCQTTTSCSGCSPGYTLVQGGTLCQLTCSDTRCLLCPSSPSTCENCQSGYTLTTLNGVTSCSATFCQIAYCATCATVSTCSACVTGFSLASSSTVCSSNCPASGLNNCLLCSAGACIVCMQNYVLSAGSCTLPCSSIVNCVACISSTLCASCASGYSLSADYTTCNMACVVRGCIACPSTTSLSCDTCGTGFVKFTEPGTTLSKCSKTCPEGTVGVTSGGSTTCQSCSTSIANCLTCSQLANSTVVCSTCLGGYFLNGFTCDLCTTAIAGCLTCISASRCTECSTGFNNVNGICDQGTCSSGVTNCMVCLSTAPSVCAICNLDFSLVNGVCTALACSNSFVVDPATSSCVCPSGTYQSTSGTTPTCLTCSSRCTNCTVSVCYACSQGYYPVGSSCLVCLPNCQTCKIGSACEICLEGYSLDAGLCVSLGASGTLAADGSTFLLCESGCQACQVSSTSSTGSVCTLAAAGYSIVGGVVVKCHPNCLTCASYLVSICTSCYPRSVLKSGTCVSCGDPHALVCSSLNLNYALICEPGYTGGAYSTSSAVTGGTCQACSLYCVSCLSNGPGQCDSNGCIQGTVQVTGTTNCTKCFAGCTTCSASDPNQCLDCGNQRFLTTAGSCQGCPTGCQTCTSATNCQSCTQDYFLVGTGCTILPAFCVSLNSTGVCSKCFGGYLLNTGTNACDVDISCNTGSTCTACAQGYTLSGGVCSACSLGSNCVACSSTSATTCVKCTTGFYLDASSACQSCTANCLACTSASFCSQAASGFFISLAVDGSYSGVVGQCYYLCATCIDISTFCLSCVSGYTLQGSTCVQDLYLALTLVLGPGVSNSIFQSAANANQQLSDSIKQVNRICNHLVAILPATFFRVGNQTCFDLFNIQSMAAGSVIFTANLNGGSNTNSQTAASSFTSALTSGTPDGFTVVSSSVTPNGGSSSTSSSASLGLILGLSIPLAILLILVVLIIVKSKWSDQEEEDTPQRWKEEEKAQTEERVSGVERI